MRIDVHNHFLPETYVDRLLEWDTPVGIDSHNGNLYLRHQRSGTASVRAGDRIPLNPGFTEMEVRRDWMSQYDIDRTIASVSTPNPYAEAFDPDQSTTLIQAINDGYAEVEDEYPDSFSGLGMVPLREPDIAAAEVDRIAEELDLSGICLPTSVEGKPLSDPALETAFEAIEDHDLTVFVHPHGNALADTLHDDERFLSPLVIFPTETAFQIARLIYDGFFDRHDFDLVLSHMGGTLIPLAGRLDRARREMDDDGPPERPVQEYLGEFYYDVISFHPPTLRTAVETVGVERLLFGTDYPFDEEDIDTLNGHLEAVVPKPAERRQIERITAGELF